MLTTLDSVHDVGIEHCDIRLENICFHPADFHIVLIDIDHAMNRTELTIGFHEFDSYNGQVYNMI